MRRVLATSVVVLAATCIAPLVAQSEEWSVDTLREQSVGFHDSGIRAQLEQIARLVQAGAPARAAIAASIHGEHREYQLKIARYLDQLADDRWLAREDAERTLVEIGGRALAQIEERSKSGQTLEERIRSARVLEAIGIRGTEDEERENRLLRGLVATALYLGSDDAEWNARLRRALASSIGHTDPTVVASAVRAMGTVGTAAEVPMLESRVAGSPQSSSLRSAALAALGRIPGGEALAAAERLLRTPDLLRPSEAMVLLRALWLREDAAPLVESLRDHPDPAIAALAGLEAAPGPATAAPVPVELELADRTTLPARLVAIAGDVIVAKDAVDGLENARILLQDCEALAFAGERAAPTGARVFLTQGTLLAGPLKSVDPESILVESRSFGPVRIARADVQGLALDPSLDRLVGASTEVDRVRLRDNRLVDGSVLGIDANELTLQEPAGERRAIPLAEVAGVLFRRPRTVSQDDSVYTRVDTLDGERLLTHLGFARAGSVGLFVPGIGATTVPVSRLARLEFGVGGGAMWGFTLVADYSDNTVTELDDQGRVVFTLEDVYGAWDAECLDSGNLLVTEFALNRVVEVTRAGEVVWTYADLRNPYDADRLPNGNTLIADTFGERVIEVKPDGTIAWTFGGVKPFDVERLPNGNTLIADASAAERVVEVDPAGAIVWELSGYENAYDVDRLPNGNTLITQRSVHRVTEVDRDGKVVFALEDLSSPSDADRLPNGNTLVAENQRIREFDRRGAVVFERPAMWAVEVNRY